MTLLGIATPQATANYALKFKQLPFNKLPKSDLLINQVGFGGYRIDDETKAHKEALRLALQQGINLLDTSSNYTNGRSESLIGSLLTELCHDGLVLREELVLVSKVGYLQGKNYELARQRRKEGRPFPNLVKYSTGLDHCIHPEFITDQLERTCQRLNVETVDIYLLHNPEYYLSWAKVANIPLEEARLEYYRRIRLAFEQLEEEVSNGRIQSYGISSNTFPNSAKSYTFTSIEKLVQIAESITPNHHFRMIQLPFNLFETGAVSEQNAGKKQSTVAYAKAHHIGVLVNRPLNAFYDEQLIRLADVIPPSYPTTVEEVSTLVDSLRAEEAQFKSTWLPQLNADAETARQLQKYLALGQMLDGKWQGFGSYQTWQDLQSRFFVPRAQSAIQFLSQIEETTAVFQEWLDRYIDSFNETLMAVSAFYQEVGANEATRLQETAVSIDPDWQANSLSQTAVRAIRSSAGISCTLVGMRQPSYVQDILADLAKPVEIRDRVGSWTELKKGLGAEG